MWQSRVEIEGYSIMYFNLIATFESIIHTVELSLKAEFMWAS